MERLLKSEILTLRPASLNDKRRIFDWLANSNLTREMLGPPKFPDNPIPSWEEFDKDYADYYFDGSQPMKGRCFVIQRNGQDVGQINYNDIDRKTSSTEMDIWMADRKFTGKGFGTHAIRIFIHFLAISLSCKTIYVAPSRRNGNAIKSYKKAGFIETDKRPVNFVADYADTVVLVRTGAPYSV